VKKNNQWQKPDLNVMVRSKKNMDTYRSVKDLYGVGVPPAPSKSRRDPYGVGVPPVPPAMR
jgi:hypothetical protein